MPGYSADKKKKRKKKAALVVANAASFQFLQMDGRAILPFVQQKKKIFSRISTILQPRSNTALVF